MPSRVITVGATVDYKILGDISRSVLIVQNIDTTATDYLYIGDEPSPHLSGVRLSGGGGSITLRKVDGEEPQKTWYLRATTATTPVRLTELFGKVDTGNGGGSTPPTPPPPERIGWL